MRCTFAFDGTNFLSPRPIRYLRHRLSHNFAPGIQELLHLHPSVKLPESGETSLPTVSTSLAAPSVRSPGIDIIAGPPRRLLGGLPRSSRPSRLSSQLKNSFAPFRVAGAAR